jgi:5-methylcytosine-specific restriction endonuclease McrA
MNCDDHKDRKEYARRANQLYYYRHLEQQRQRSRIKSAKRFEQKRSIVLQTNREWAAKNSDKIKLRQKQYHLENLEKRKAQNKEWRRLHGKESRRRLLKQNPSRDIFYSHNRRALKRAATINLANIKRWMDSVKNSPTSICYYCQLKIPSSLIHFDHIVALSRGGAHSVENLCISCASCNLSKNNKDVGAWIRIGQQVLSL